MKIQKINNLNELRELKVDSIIGVFNILESIGMEEIYEGNKLINEVNMHSFLSFNRDIEIKSYNQDFYHPSDKDFNENLKIWGRIV